MRACQIISMTCEALECAWCVVRAAVCYEGLFVRHQEATKEEEY